jgi:hypothetical protein
MLAHVSALTPQLLKIVTLFGLLLGMLGALFLAYDLLGSHDGPLRKFLRLALPGLVGAITIVPLYVLAHLAVQFGGRLLAPGRAVGRVDFVDLLITAPAVGVFLGVMNALYDQPACDHAARPAFSLRDFRSGILLALVYSGLTDLFQFARHPYLGLPARDYWVVEVSSLLATALVVGAAAGLWRAASRLPLVEAKPPRFTAREAMVGTIAAAAMVLVPSVVTGIAVTALVPWLQEPGIVALNVALAPLLTALAIAPAGAAIGGLWPRAFWWANHASDNRLELIGVLCILAGFVAGAVEPLVDLLKL